jgi:hypothetical protein
MNQHHLITNGVHEFILSYWGGFFSYPLRRLFANGGRGNFCFTKKKKKKTSNRGE